MKRNYEVIIAGAGPAGATLAYELANKGISLLLLEKEILPRYKCCAGGLAMRTAKLLGTDITETVEDVVSGVTITFAGNSPYRGHHDQTLMYTVMRDKFDYALVKRAAAAGAVVLQEHRVKGIQFGDSGVEVSTPAGDFRSQFLVGADGAGSVVARALGLKNNTSRIAALETEVLVAEEELARWRSQITIDVGCVPGGYAWVFPKLNHLSIGIACLSSQAKGLKHRYREFLHSLNIRHYTITRWSGSLIPICSGEVVASRGRAALLGDAAGLVDPLTGEGIYNAILSAQLAAPVIEQSLIHDEAGLSAYQQAVDEKIMPEMKIARFLSRIMVRFPSMVLKMLHRDERVWRGGCYLLRGEIDYTTIRKKLGELGGIYAFLKRK